MLHSRSYLDLCHELLKRGHQFQLIPGLRIGRGFADVGYEEYSVLTGFSIISLHSGKSISLGPDYNNFYFPIYSIDEMGKLLYESSCDIEEIHYHNQRTWVLFISTEDKTVERFEGEILEEAFLKAMLWKLER